MAVGVAFIDGAGAQMGNESPHGFGRVGCQYLVKVVVRQRSQGRLDRFTFTPGADDGIVDVVQTLVFENEPRPAGVQPRPRTLPAQPLAFDRTRREGIDLDFRPQMPRQNLGQRPLPGFGNGIIAAVGIGHRHVFLAAKVRADVENVARALFFSSVARFCR